MKKKLFIVGIIIAIALVIYIVSKRIKKDAKLKADLNTYGGLTKEEFKRKLQLAWKDNYYAVMKENLSVPNEGYAEWRKGIDEGVSSGKYSSLDEAILHATQFAWAKDNPKAWGNGWSQGWLSQVYVKDTLGLDPNDKDIKSVMTEV